MRAAVLPALLAAIATMPSCSSLQCAPGTFHKGDTCVDYDPNDKTPPTTTLSPPGMRSRQPLPVSVMLASDEPAQIYYTTDGSDPDPATTPPHRDQATIVEITQGMTIKFFSVDLAGNREAEQTATFDSDTTPPAQVSNLSVTITNGTTAHVTWTPPTTPDFAGVVLARVDELVDGSPVPGTIYSMATPPMLSPDLEIVSTGIATSFDDPGRAPGPVRYVAWTYDDLGNYSAPVAATADVPVGSLNASLTYNTATSMLAVTSSPANLDLTGTTATLSGTTLTVTLMVKNNTKKYFQNPKAEVTSLTNATFGNSDGTADTFAFRSLGPNALAPGATASATLVLNGVTAGSNPVLALTFASHASLVSTHGGRNTTSPGVGLVDVGSGALLPSLVTTQTGPNNRGGGKSRGAVLLAGHLLAVATTHGVIELFDLATGMHVAAVQIGNQDTANVQSLLWTGADLIAVVKYAGNRHAGAVDLVRLDEKLRVTARHTLTVSDDNGFGRAALSADGALLAAPISGGVLLVDAPTLTPIDADPTTPELDLLDPGITGRLGSIVFFNGHSLLVLAKMTGQAAVLKPDGNGGYARTMIYDDGTASRGGFSAALAPDGKIWMGFPSSIRTYDPATDVVTQLTGYTSALNGLAQVAGQMWVVRSDRMTLDQVSPTGAVQRTITLPQITITYTGGSYICSPSCNGMYGHWLDTAR